MIIFPSAKWSGIWDSELLAVAAAAMTQLPYRQVKTFLFQFASNQAAAARQWTLNLCGKSAKKYKLSYKNINHHHPSLLAKVASLPHFIVSNFPRYDSRFSFMLSRVIGTLNFLFSFQISLSFTYKKMFQIEQSFLWRKKGTYKDDEGSTFIEYSKGI